MKVQQFAAVLKTMEKLYEDAGAQKKKQILVEFSKIFSGYEKKTVTAFVNLIEKKAKN